MEWLDSFLEFLNESAVALSAVVALLVLVEFAFKPIRALLKWRKRPSYFDPELSLPPETSDISRYSSRTRKVLGRDREHEQLREFLNDLRPFLWLQLAGNDGPGKSRLALLSDWYATSWLP